VWRECVLRAAGFPIDGLEPLAAPAYARAADELAAARRADPSSKAEVARLEAELRDAAERALVEEAAVLRGIAADPLFREAVTWQNRDARRWATDPYAGTTAGTKRNNELRQREGTVIRYWQRYCAKNDTIGFFGPVCWATIVDAGEAVEAEPGPTLLRERIVYLERWCVAAYADALAQDPEVRPWLPPRPHPHQFLDKRTVHRPPHPPAELRPADAGVLGLCDGERPAREVARLAVADPELGLRREPDAMLVLESLARQNLVVLEAELPLELHPERTLRRHLERIDDEPVRARALDGLDRLDHGRAAVAAGAGDVAALEAALDDLGSVFTELTGKAPTHAHGQAYAGRTLVFEDTRRDLDVRIGPPLLEAVGPAVDLLLAGSRWLTGETARAYRDLFRQAYEDELRPGESVVELGQVWPWLQAGLFGASGRPIDTVMAEFLGRWSRILQLDVDRRRVQFDSAALRERVAAEFPGGGPGWPGARYQSADLQIDAASVAALNDGEFQVVLGELHTAWNTLETTVFAAQHPDPLRLLGFVTTDLPDPRVLAVVPGDWPRSTGRTVNFLVRDDDLRLGWTPAPPPAKGTLLRLGELVVDDVGDELHVRTRDGRLTFDPIVLLGSFLSEVVVDAYKTAFTGGGDHVPRTSIDRLVVSRETWRFPLHELGFASAKDEVQRFAGARAWRLEQDLPEHVFAGFAHETKPFGVDFRSPAQVQALAASVRAGIRKGDPEGRVVISEMLPAPEGAWVPDGQGRTYVSELRLQFVDPEPFRPW
jgi:hypothetical protein